MNSAATHTIRLTNGENWVRFEMFRNGGFVSFSNSAGELAPLSPEDALERIAGLIAHGWKTSH